MKAWLSSSFSLALLLISRLVAPSDADVGSISCPGLGTLGSGATACTATCQQAVCAALKAFYSSTYNATTPFLESWRSKDGWEVLGTQTCEQLSLSTVDGTPTYCSWFGITCCSVGMQYVGYCDVVNTPLEIKLELNGLNGSVEDQRLQEGIAQLHACGLKSLILSGNALSGSLTDFWGQLVNLNALNLAKNMIHGTIPDALRKLTKLAALQLDRNMMHGTLPEWLSELQALQWLSLSAFAGYNPDGRRGLIGTIPASLGSLRQVQFLSLASKSLNGTLPAELCHPAVDVLQLRNNRLSGDLTQLLSCSGVSFLDISDNKFSGTLPNTSSWNWTRLMYLDVSSNELSGTLPPAFYGLSKLSMVNMANNRLTGTINRLIGQMPYMMNIDFHNNQLTGQIDESVWYIPHLQIMDLSHNNLKGTLSPAIGMSYLTISVLLNDNNLTGHIPPEIGILNSLMSVDLRNNSLGCNQGNDGITEQCIKSQQLPCFLEASQLTMPLPDASNMECPLVRRKAHEQAMKDCRGNGTTQLGNQVADLADVEVRLQRPQNWDLDPGYYQYVGCKCLGGFSEQWSKNYTVLTCVAKHGSGTGLLPWVAAVAAVFSVLGLLLLVAIIFAVSLGRAARLRRRWKRDKQLLRDRQKGVPAGGPATIVVTDVESYSELMQQNAAVTTRAMGIHNSILRKAVSTHAGHVIEQEGDSWSVAFHRPVDAVAFCLQVQQALQKAHWPSELGGTASKKPVNRHSSVTSSTSDTSHVTLEGSNRQPTNRRSVVFSSISTSFTGKQAGSQTGNFRSLNLSSVGGFTSLPGLLRRGKVPFGRSTKVASAEDTGPEVTAPSQTQQHESGRHTSFESERADRRTSSNGDMSRDMHSVTNAGSEKSSTSGMGVIRGLKVRMGVVSGWVPENTDIRRSAVFEIAKAVSDKANGGQVLLDASTAEAVLNWLADLAGVDNNGYNDKIAQSASNAEGLLQRLSFRSIFAKFSGASPHDREPLLLDMGQFYAPAIGSALRATAAAAKSHGQPGTNNTLETAVVGWLQNGQAMTCTGTKASIAAAAAAAACGFGVSGACRQMGLHLFCIVARPLHARAKVWSGKLNLSPQTQIVTRGYFDAPGTDVADLGPTAAFLNLQRSLLPPVTIVFACIEGGKVLVRKKDHVATVVHNVLGRTMQALLLSLPDGYLCREQEAVLKYMVAFREPARAAEWCLMMQEVLQQLPWPMEVMDAFAALSSSRLFSNSGGRVSGSTTGLGQRPSLKMGLAEGVPDSISPDHLGRADYFGTSVNLAARIMSAAAQPGHVAMSMDMAQGVFSSWQYEAHAAQAGNAQQLQSYQNNNWQFSLSGSTPASPGTRMPATLPSAADLRTNSVTAMGANTAAAGQEATQHIMKSGSQSQPRPDYTAQSSDSQGTREGAESDDSTSGPSSAAGDAEVQIHGAGQMGSDVKAPKAADNKEELDPASASDSSVSETHRVVHVSAEHIGTYAFKGCGAMDVVSLRSDAVYREGSVHKTASSKGAKGTLVMAASGPVLGLQDCPVKLPNIMPEFRQAWANIISVPRSDEGADRGQQSVADQDQQPRESQSSSGWWAAGL